MIIVDVKKRILSAHGAISLNASIEIQTGEFISIFGASGVGKTSILRMISGLMHPEEGRIEVDNEIWFDHSKKINLRPQDRRVGFVFQDYGLFPHMTVRENIEFALDNGKETEFIDELINIIHLKALENEKPAKLSGGQKQRVALARALARKPKILLLDEPFSALDLDMRLRLRQEIVNIYKRFKMTTIFVSHDLLEISKLSQRVILIEYGKPAKSLRPEEINNTQNTTLVV